MPRLTAPVLARRRLEQAITTLEDAIHALHPPTSPQEQSAQNDAQSALEHAKRAYDTLPDPYKQAPTAGALRTSDPNYHRQYAARAQAAKQERIAALRAGSATGVGANITQQQIDEMNALVERLK